VTLPHTGPAAPAPAAHPRRPAFRSRRAGVVARRIVRQVRADRRSLAMILVVPVLVILLLGYILRASHMTVTLAIAASGSVVLPGAAPPAGLRIVPAGPDAAEDLRAGRIQGLLVLAPGAPPALTVRGDDPGTVRLLQTAARQVVGALSDPAGTAAPPAITTAYLHGGPEFDRLDYYAPVLVGFFAFFFVFLLTAVSFLRERTTGTLERLLISPLRRLELVTGYMLGFGLFALAQTVLLVLVAIVVLQLHVRGQPALVLLVTALLAVGGVNLGIFCSTFARTELQAIQFIPVVLVPQALLSGLLFAVDSLPGWLQVVAHLLPMTYAAAALRAVMIAGSGLDDGGMVRDILVLAGFAVAFLGAAALTLRQEVA
jgi:ABC-2 type transport system permease protein